MPTIIWEGIEVTLSHTDPGYCLPFQHLEIRSKERLPITETGYKSHFIAPAELALWDSPEAFVRNWLDDAAKHPLWVKYRKDSRQLSLF